MTVNRRALALAAALVLLSASALAGPRAGNAAPRKGAPCCAEEGEGAKKCDPASATAVTLTGTVLCEHCDLKTAKSCNSVFRAEGREAVLPFCPESKELEALKKAGAGKAKLEVKGTVCRTKDGKELLVVESFSKKG